VPVQTVQTSFAFSLPQRTCSLGLNGYLGCTCLIPGGLCCKEMGGRSYSWWPRSYWDITLTGDDGNVETSFSFGTIEAKLP
jgi:hypothetical protein